MGVDVRFRVNKRPCTATSPTPTHFRLNSKQGIIMSEKKGKSNKLVFKGDKPKKRKRKERVDEDGEEDDQDDQGEFSFFSNYLNVIVVCC